MKKFLLPLVAAAFLLTACSEEPKQTSKVESITVQETECNFLDVVNGQPNAEVCQSACETICGPGYTIAEMQQIAQTNKNGIICKNTMSNPALEEMQCDEVRENTTGKSCVTYNKIINNLELGMQWQCIRAISQK